VDPISFNLAGEIAQDMIKEEGVSESAALDFQTIITISKILLSLANNCAAVMQDLDKLRNPSLINRIRLRRSYVAPAVRNSMTKRVHLRMLLGILEQSIAKAILRRAKTATAEEVARLIAEAKLAKPDS
jgi:hypothetical protein